MIRSFIRDSDLAGLVRLRSEIEACDHAGNDVSEESANETLNWPDHDPERDRWVAVHPDQQGVLTGYSYALRQSPERTIVYAAVHPDWRRLGLGGSLLDRALGRASELGATHATSAANVKNEAAEGFLLGKYFERAGHNRFFTAPAGVLLPEPVWPAGYSVRTYSEVRDLSTLVEAFNVCYGDMWGHRENAAGAMNEEYLDGMMLRFPHLYDPDGIIVAFGPGGDIAGVSVAIIGPGSDGTLTVDSPGVAPGHRHLGLQRPLTLESMQRLRKHGQGPISLESYGDGDEAAGIYLELGFALEEHFVEYCRRLT